jgi:hypothetical protein
VKVKVKRGSFSERSNASANAAQIINRPIIHAKMCMCAKYTIWTTHPFSHSHAHEPNFATI